LTADKNRRRARFLLKVISQPQRSGLAEEGAADLSGWVMFSLVLSCFV
jgi:hypothetical protein